METKVFGDFLVVVLFSSPLPLLLNFARLETFHVFFAVVLSRDRRKKTTTTRGRGEDEGLRRGEEEEEEEGVLLTLVVTTDPGKCAQLDDYRRNQDG